MSHNITPFIRCTSGAQQQAEFYCSVFPQATITNHNSIVTTFQIYGGTLATLNGGDHPGATLNPSISFSLRIKDKDETKRIRDLLAEGGSVMMPFQDYFWSPAYGRCNDKYGVSRQVMYDPSTEPGHETDKIIPSLLYVQHNNGKAQEAMELYTSLFPNSAIKYVRPYEAGQGETVGNIAHAEFTLNDQLFIAADSGQNHTFTFTDGVSLAIACDGQDEVDYYWEKLIADGGSESMCGRCKDKYGVSRQVVPVQLQQALFQDDQTKAKYAMDAMLKMKKIVIEDLYIK